jgi:hypothetical protein
MPFYELLRGGSDMRRVISLVLLVSFLSVSITGLFMEGHGGKDRPRPARSEIGTVANGVDANHASRPGPSFFPKGLHELAGYTMLVVGTIHLGLNFRPIKNYLGFRRRSC